MKLVIANRDYEPGAFNESNAGHMSTEGMELQRGLREAGWVLSGAGFEDNLRDVPSMLQCYSPEAVLVQDKRDLDARHGGFREGIMPIHLEALAEFPTYRLAVVKDAGSSTEYQRQFCEQIKAHAAVIYYHPQSVLPLSPWLKNYDLIRTYHSVDKDLIQTLNFNDTMRRNAIVTGAVSSVYPLRERVIKFKGEIGCDVLPHPGYHNRGEMTPCYLAKLAQYRVHIATASAYGFALRKIIESVAVGATPVTDLPSYDVLPEIDAALVRVSPGAAVAEIRSAVFDAAEKWNVEERKHFQEIALRNYDWRVIGKRLSNLIAANQGRNQ